MVDMNGSITVMAKAVATAASTALPPRARMPAPTSAPRQCSAATIPFRASGVCLVTTTCDRIMGPPGELRAGRQVLRDVDDVLAGEVDGPALEIHPHRGGIALDCRTVPGGDRFHAHRCPAES